MIQKLLDYHFLIDKHKPYSKEKIDKELIGGYVLRVGDTQIDTSVRKKINDLKLELA